MRNEQGLCWTLQTVNLDDGIGFDALFYMWKLQDDQFSITCNNRRHYIYHNLHIALPYLNNRHKYKHRWK